MTIKQTSLFGSTTTKIKYISEPHPDANLITESFGIDAGYVQSICDLEIPDDYDILYITGESGSGKSSIINSMFPNRREVEIPKEPLFQWCGNSKEEQIKAIKILSFVGLSDATMFVNYYERLSDSQKARSKIALEIMSGKKTIVVDEFLSTLDRKTAQAVSFCIQKVVRQMGIKAVFSSAHDDIIPYLQPKYIISGRSFPSRFEIIDYKTTEENPILSRTTYFYGDNELYKNLYLGNIHYKGKYTGGTKEYLYAEYGGEVIACLVSIYRMNDGGRRIARLVVHPSYRGIGIGKSLVKQYTEDYEGVDVIASMALFNPVFEKAGMERVADSIIKPPSGLGESIKCLGFELDKWHSKTYCEEFAGERSNRETIAQYSTFATMLVCPGGANLTADEIAEKIKGDAQTAGRVLYGLRPRTMAKYVSKHK